MQNERVMKPDSQKSLRKTIQLFFILFIVSCGIVGGLASAFYRSEINSLFKKIKSQEILTVTLVNKTIADKFCTIISDLFFLSKQNELIAYLDTGNTDQLRLLESEYVEISKRCKIYDQLRYVDSAGREVARVNYNNGNVSAVPAAKLQDKSHRYYFTDAIQLTREEVYASPLDLNIENKEIEKPFKPMIRFATPVYDSKAEKSGVVLINYLADTLLRDLEKPAELSMGNIMLINPEGYWLQNQSIRDTEWGFMFAGRKKQTFPSAYPEEWSIIQNTKIGQIETDSGLFTYRTIYPLKNTIAANSSDYYWVAVSHVPTSMLNYDKNNLLFTLFAFGSGLFVFIALGSWFASLTLIRTKMHKCELIKMATHDTLTSLPNRRMCYERLQSSVDHAKRFDRKLAVLYIDLDGFKTINDIHGHAAGDALLRKVSEILTTRSRSSDVVARLGGDEFVCILSEIDSPEGAMHAGNKIVEALQAPIQFKSESVIIGASVGVAIYPDHDTDPDRLLIKADSAMYDSKSKGKNTCTMFQGASA